MKAIRKKIALALAIATVTTCMVGCSNKSVAVDESAAPALSELTITHVTSPLNVPSILQKNKGIFTEEFSANGKTIEVKYAEIT